MGGENQLAYAVLGENLQHLAPDVLKDACVEFVDGKGEGRIIICSGQKAQHGNQTTDPVRFVPQGQFYSVAYGNELYKLTGGTVFHDCPGQGVQFNGKAGNQLLNDCVYPGNVPGNNFIGSLWHIGRPVVCLDGEGTHGRVQQQRQVQADEAGRTGIDHKEIIQSEKIQFQQYLQIFGVVPDGFQILQRFTHKDERLGAFLSQTFVYL